MEFNTLAVETAKQTIVLNLIANSLDQILENTKDIPKEWMSIQEACNYIGISFNTFNKFRVMGLKVAEIDGVKRVSRSEIDRFLIENSF